MTSPPEVQLIANLGPDDFDTLVRASLGRDADRAVWDALTDPAVINRTKLALAAIHTDVQNQLNLANTDLATAKAGGYALGEDGKQAYLAVKADQGDWRRRAIGFRRIVEQRVAFVKSRIPQQAPQPPGAHATRKRNQDALEKLARAVTAHRDKVLSGEGGEGDDDTLWDCLDSITAVTMRGGEMPLAKWLDWLDEVREDDE
jgi:hypothetical protein